MFQKNSGMEEMCKNVDFHVFPSTFFCLTSSKTLWGNTHVFQKMSSMEKN